MSLPTRLAGIYAIALFVALLAFAAFALVVLDRVQTSALDDRLLSAARASLALASEPSAITGTRERRALARTIGPRIGAALVDANGRIVESTVPDYPDEIARAPIALVPTTVGPSDETLRMVRADLTRSRPGVAAVVLWTPRENIADLTRRVAAIFAFAIPLAIAISVGLGTLVARRGLRPLRAVAALAADIEAHDLSQRLGLTRTPDEIGALAAAFDRMLDRLQAAFEREKRFSADASHELRAPLSIVRVEAELALARERSGDEYRAALRSIVVEADALEALTRDLLHAARSDVRAVPPAREIDLAAIARRTATATASLAQAKNVSLACYLAPAPMMGDATMLERTALAFVDNAIKYARAGGDVTIATSREGRFVTLSVADDGPGFGDDALRHASERFGVTIAFATNPAAGSASRSQERRSRRSAVRSSSRIPVAAAALARVSQSRARLPTPPSTTSELRYRSTRAACAAKRRAAKRAPYAKRKSGPNETAAERPTK